MLRTCKALVARSVLALIGWRLIGTPPAAPKWVLIGAPHTSNWDFMFFVLLSWRHGFDASWVGKHTLFKGPFGWLARALGGLPVDRSARAGLVDQVAQAYAAADRLVVAIAPEGTRHYAPHWKSGFYHIAVRAGVPIQLCFLDYPRKVGGFGLVVEPSGDLGHDFALFAEFYKQYTGLHPDQSGPVAVGVPDRTPAPPRPVQG